MSSCFYPFDSTVCCPVALHLRGLMLPRRVTFNELHCAASSVLSYGHTWRVTLPGTSPGGDFARLTLFSSTPEDISLPAHDRNQSTRLMPYSAADMYAIVNNVAAYPQYCPGVVESKYTRKQTCYWKPLCK